MCRKGINGWIKLIYIIWSSSATFLVLRRWDSAALEQGGWFVDMLCRRNEWSDEKSSFSYKTFMKLTDSSLQEQWTGLKPPVVFGLLLWWLHVTSVQALRGFCSGRLMVCVIVFLWHSNTQQCLQAACSVPLESLCCWKCLIRYWTCSLMNLYSMNIL